MTPAGPPSNSSLRDNRSRRGTVGDFLKSEIQPGSVLSFVSAYFTVHAYEALADQLESAAELRFLFGEPSFITGIDRGDKQRANFKLTEHGVTIAKTLTQRPAAKACAEWIERMVEIRSIRQSNFLHGKAYHVENGNASSAILGSSNFTVPGLGLGTNSNIELNLVVDSDRDRKDLKAWFNEVWSDDTLSKDVKEEVLTYLRRLASHRIRRGQPARLRPDRRPDQGGSPLPQQTTPGLAKGCRRFRRGGSGRHFARRFLPDRLPPRSPPFPRKHRSQHERNLRARGIGFDERILATDRAAAGTSGHHAAESFEMLGGF